MIYRESLLVRSFILILNTRGLPDLQKIDSLIGWNRFSLSSQIGRRNILRRYPLSFSFCLWRRDRTDTPQPRPPERLGTKSDHRKLLWDLALRAVAARSKGKGPGTPQKSKGILAFLLFTKIQKLLTFIPAFLFYLDCYAVYKCPYYRRFLRNW